MRKLRIITAFLFVLSAVLAGSVIALRVMRTDKTIPVISFGSEVLTLSAAEVNDDALRSDVTAWDDKDGDLSEHVQVLSLTRRQGNEMTARYAVADRDNYVTAAERTVVLEDYAPPRFRLTQPLSYNVGASMLMKDRLTAEDLLDGNISGKIHVYINGMSTSSVGSFPITVAVTNSLGDSAELTLNATVQNHVDGAPEIRLREYLVYLEEDEEFDPMDYFQSVTTGEMSDVSVRLPKDYLQSVTTGEVSDVSVRLPKGGFEPGVNEVVFSCESSNGITGSVTMFVVQE